MTPRNPYESAHWNTATGLMRPGGLALTQHLLERAGLRRGARVLDLGCGRGMATAFLSEAGFLAVGLDASPLLSEDARRRHPHLTFVTGDAAALPFDGGAFDAVLLECVLSAVATEPVLAECARVTGAEGVLMCADVYDPDGGDGPLSRPWWAARLTAAGFACTHWEDRTRDLQRFAAQLLWDAGSPRDLCGCMRFAMPPRARYFALVAARGGAR